MNRWLGVSVTDLSMLEKVNGPVAVPDCFPNTRKLDAVIDVRSTGTSKVIVTVVVPDATPKRAGLRADGSTAIGHALPAVHRINAGAIVNTRRVRTPLIAFPLRLPPVAGDQCPRVYPAPGPKPTRVW